MEYIVDTEEQAKALIEEEKKSKEYIVGSYQSTKKQKKQKGEIVEEWYAVKVVRIYQ
jgi:hypothetical protein